jgi:DNA-binding FadR family transcriptional regulator
MMASDAATGFRVERKPKLSETVVAAIRKQLVAGEIQPGQKLPTEEKMTETFGVSRTVIREALASLAADGLVEPRQGAGVFVLDHPTLTLGSMSQEISKISQAINVLEVRMGIEVEASGLAATRRNAAQVALIQEAFFEFERVLKLGQPTGKADFAFHREIASATNNPLYVEMLDALGDRTIPCDRTSPWYSVEVLSVDYLAKLQREHLLVLKAISAGDAAAAREAMRAHLVAAQARYSERLVGQQAEYLAGAKR